MSFLRRVRRFIFDHSKEAYRFFLTRVVIRLFGRPDVAVTTAFRATDPGSERVVASALSGAMRARPPSPEKVIAGYCQCLVLTGRHGTDDLVWTYMPKRAVITAETVRVPREFRRLMNKGQAEIRRNQNFSEVLAGCRRENWSWITDPFIEFYTELAEVGLIECFEAHCDGKLVAGSWGLVVGNTLYGMSTFYRVSGMGNVLWGVILTQLQKGEFEMIDCGEMRPLFARFGAEVVPREVFIERVVRGVIRSTQTGASA